MIKSKKIDSFFFKEEGLW